MNGRGLPLIGRNFIEPVYDVRRRFDALPVKPHHHEPSRDHGRKALGLALCENLRDFKALLSWRHLESRCFVKVGGSGGSCVAPLPCRRPGL